MGCALGRTGCYLQELEDGLSFARLRPEWSGLHARSAAGPFLSWEWLYAFWRRVAPTSTPRILTARDRDGTLVGVLPLYETVTRSLGVTTRRWGLLGDRTVGSDYLEVLCESGREEELTALFARHLEQKLPRIDVLELTDLAVDRPQLARALTERLSGHCLSLERETLWTCPQVHARTSWDEYLRSVGRADTLHRRRKWLGNQPGYAIDRAEKPAEVARSLVDFFRLHRLRWERDGGSQGIDSPEIRSFHRDAAMLLAECGKLRLYTLRIGEKALASVYAVVDARRIYYYQSGYDPEWTKRSVGLVLLAEVIGDAFREGKEGFDFLRGSEPYKFEWANGQREIEALRLVNRTAGGAAWLAARDGQRSARGALKQLVGKRIWEAAKRQRRGQTALRD